MTRPKRQGGFALIESLVALTVLSVGLAGLGRFLARDLAEARMTNARAIALQSIDAIGESLALHPAALALAGAPDWAELAEWRESLDAALPGGTATVFRSTTDNRQIGIAIAWPANERAMDDADAVLQAALLQMTAADSGFACPPASLCQVSYVQP